MDSDLGEKIQLVMSRFNSWVFLSLIFFLTHNSQALAQCPEKAVLEGSGLDNSGPAEVLVYDGLVNIVDVTAFEINIYNESTGNYIFTESSNFPMIGTSEVINIEKQSNRILIIDIPENIDLLECAVVFVGGDCPPKAVAINIR